MKEGLEFVKFPYGKDWVKTSCEHCGAEYAVSMIQWNRVKEQGRVAIDCIVCENSNCVKKEEEK